MKLLINQNDYWKYNWWSGDKCTAQSLKIVDDEWKTIVKEVWDKTFKCVLRLDSSEDDTTDDLQYYYDNFEIGNIIDFVSFNNETEDKSLFLGTLIQNYDLICSNHKKDREDLIKKKIEQLQKELDNIDDKYNDDTQNIVDGAKYRFNESFGRMKSFMDRTKLKDLVEWSETYNSTLWQIIEKEVKYNVLQTLFNFLFTSNQSNGHTT